ncbi:transcriptional regulator NrdR [Cellulosilyticum sp. ST5]|uniref:Transcriptional repressor NrdR n=1 Tax=Cellulosilyticum lentocellum (strain ATCC 49066 / DSM 5427 / NCIMB 11756 / RHM5) TaxID=642492 RepID=F2JS94_CELLD|nr:MULTISPECIES: transcriptional regulator NrdR [Cellulosilyticum]ADZ84031.1 Ribonucleotide reductase regulator NrdR-like protein [Cellulosilyticum lentocellum DSM 5427]QEH69497.1 transcriptional repressor NrdR [Cellulosilyticum sp. WCF-2]
MKCPYCGYSTSKVLNSRPVNENDSIRRRRQCESCNKRFTTYEKIESIPLVVIKRDKSREVFERDKLFKGILRSCNKRNISIEQIEDLVDTIENQICNGEKKEVSSTEIGEMTMQALKNLDEVSYIRFASVYKQFVCIDEFITELENIKKLKR